MDRTSVSARIFLYLMAAGYLAAGLNHFFHPQGYIKIMPVFLPYPRALVYISGAFEIILSLLLLPRKTRKIAAWGVIFLLIAIFPANIQMTIDFGRNHNPGFWLTILRLPLQAVLIWWAWRYTR